MGRKYLQKTHLIKDCCRICKEFLKLKRRKQTTQLKNEPRTLTDTSQRRRGDGK
jgi:hypothetical protein